MKVKLLIVDDEEGITSSLTRYFEMHGYDVSSANSPVKALSMIQEDNYMVVISDIMMPEISGIELLSSIKKFNGMIQVIMITGVVTIENVLNCLQSGANDCYLKPIDDLEILKDAVDRAIARLTRWEDLIGSMVKRRK